MRPARPDMPGRTCVVTGAARGIGRATAAGLARLGARVVMVDRDRRAAEAYSRSMLAGLMFTYELARRLEGTGVTANSLHPGIVVTRLFRRGPVLYKALFGLLKPFLLSPREGAETAIHLASSPEVEGVSGGYFVKRVPARSHEVSYDEEAAARLWELSAGLTGVR